MRTALGCSLALVFALAPGKARAADSDWEFPWDLPSTECTTGERFGSPKGWACPAGMKYYAADETCYSEGEQTVRTLARNSVTGVQKMIKAVTYSCKKGVDDGTRKEYWPSGKLKARTSFRLGVQVGNYETNRIDGKPLTKGSLCVDAQDVSRTVECGPGYVNEYWDDGKLKEHKTLRNGVPFGPWESYAEDGVMTSRGSLCADPQDPKASVPCGPGFYLQRWPDGKLQFKAATMNGVLVGDYEARYASGGLEHRGKNCLVPGDAERSLACGPWQVVLEDGKPPVTYCYVASPISKTDLRVDSGPCPPLDGTRDLSTNGPFARGVDERWKGTFKKGVPVGAWLQTNGAGKVCLDGFGKLASNPESCTFPKP